MKKALFIKVFILLVSILLSSCATKRDTSYLQQNLYSPTDMYIYKPTLFSYQEIPKVELKPPKIEHKQFELPKIEFKDIYNIDTYNIQQKQYINQPPIINQPKYQFQPVNLPNLYQPSNFQNFQPIYQPKY